MTPKDLARQIRHGLYAERDTLEEAWDYVEMIANGCGDNAGPVYTAVQVMLNTISKIILEDAEKQAAKRAQ